MRVELDVDLADVVAVAAVLGGGGARDADAARGSRVATGAAVDGGDRPDGPAAPGTCNEGAGVLYEDAALPGLEHDVARVVGDAGGGSVCARGDGGGDEDEVAPQAAREAALRAETHGRRALGAGEELRLDVSVDGLAGR